MSDGKIITFYSYKGGVGRTLALANIAALLSRWDYRVLCIDWDLEAPGLHQYFSEWLRPPLPSGLVEWIHSYCADRRAAWQEHVTEIRVPGGKQPIALLPAGVFDGNYAKKMQALDWQALYEQHDLGGWLEQARAEWKERYDFVLIDSRTGISDMGGICTIQMPDFLVLLCTANHQSLDGAVDIALRAKDRRNKLPRDRGQLLSLPVAARFDVRVEYEIAKDWLQRFAEKLTPLFEEWAHSDVTASDLLNFTRIPYVPYWSFGERLPVAIEDTRDPESIGFAFESLAALLARGLSGNELLVKNRDSYVAAARRDLAPAIQIRRRGRKLAYVYAKEDKRLCGHLDDLLNLLTRQKVLETWSSRRADPGGAAPRQSDSRIEEADIVLLLFSADLLASDYCESDELTSVLRRSQAGKSIVLSIMLRPVAWDLGPLLGQTILPKSGRPISSWASDEPAWQEVVQGIRSAAEQLSQREAEPSSTEPSQSKPPQPPVLQPPAAAYDPQWYVHRDREERRAFSLLGFPGTPLVIWGPRGFGKTWMLSYILEEAWRQDGGQTRLVFINADLLTREARSSYSGFLRELARYTADQLNISRETVEKYFGDRRTETSAITRLMEAVLSASPSRLLFAIDRADTLSEPDFGSSFFGMLRSWAQRSGSAHEPWSRLRLLLSISTSPNYLIQNVDQSPFNLSTPVMLEDFGDAQISTLAGLHGLTLSSEDLNIIRSFVGGHPYLVRMLLFAAATEQRNICELIDVRSGLFDSFLESQQRWLDRQPKLRDAYRAIVEERSFSVARDEIWRLEAAGLVVADAITRSFRPRYQLYQRLLRGRE